MKGDPRPARRDETRERSLTEEEKRKGKKQY
jgi:hypothetical protein